MHNLDHLTDHDIDFNHIWHPYTRFSQDNIPCLPVVKANGVYLTLADGTELIDGMSSWWCTIHGYNHPKINAAIKNQIDTFSHVMFGGLTHKPAIELTKKLIAITPKPLSKVFFADSGSVAVEVALKMAIQYWQAEGVQTKNKILTVKGGYYGDTNGCMALCDPIQGMHHLFSGILPQHYFVEKPGCRFHEPCQEKHLSAFKKQIQKKQAQIAAVLVEPIVQGAGGMYFYSPEYLAAIRKICNEHDILLICDEIATGFGRTGKLFASEYADISPDIMCVGKALTGGYVTLGATLCTEQISEVISKKGPLMHGPTFMANPLACAAANASIELLQTSEWQIQITIIEQQLREGLTPCLDLEGVIEIRILGAIGVIEMEHPIQLKELQPKFIQQGIWIRPFNRLIYIMPPYIIKKNELMRLCAGIYQTLFTLQKN